MSRELQRAVRDSLKEVEIFFDTGADQSFISVALADELQLERTQQQELLVYTFGRKHPVTTKCEVTTLDIWDSQGKGMQYVYAPHQY